ncbi:N-6 DNA methylase [uncultured Parasutterella sp.]|uniref:N-6 DNA methylase n=2 Tax=uncultured Parasutterella sp. TaxID=1263098 RepID=UPI00272A6DC3|nr:N-6 DNA methylase [uncultured Parasutterella sp.]
MRKATIQEYRDRYNSLTTNEERFALITELYNLVHSRTRQTTEQFYTVGEKGASRQKLNDRAINLIEEFNNDPNKKPTDAEKQVLAQFSGFGGGLIDKTTGQKGSVYEYYTPKPIAEGVWDCLQGLGFSGGKILDPSAGTGIFGATAPLNAAVDAVELSSLSGRVSQLVNDGPGYNTTISNFEKVAAKTRDNVYDAVVTNVPFGAVADRGANRMDDSRYQDDPLEVYFILRSLEKLKPNGLAAFIVPMRCVSGKGGKPEELRTKATMMAEFVGAYRLPSGTFSTASTDTATDVIFFRKFSDETAEKIAELREQKPELLSEAKIQWETFIEGKYFDSYEGKKYVLSEFVAKDPTKFRDVDKVISNADLNDLREILRTRKLPKSRINWELLETSETTPIVYNEGDTINHAGCALVMRNGVWVQLAKKSED